MTKHLEGFLYQDKSNCSKKINSFIDDGKDKIYLLLDFDRTLTKSRNKLGKNVSTWEILQSHLSKDGKKKYKNFYQKYRPLEIAGRLKESEAVEWWEGILMLFKKNNLRWSDITRDVEKRMPIRPGVWELFQACEKRGIPIIIISAGIKDVIELWCQKFEFHPTVILATNLTFSSEGYIEKWSEESLIHTLNKKDKGRDEINKLKKERPNAILLGDSKDDALIIEDGKNALKIFINEGQIGESLEKNKDYYNSIFERFDLVFREKDLLPLVRIIRLF